MGLFESIFYPGYRDNWDDDQFRDEIRKYLKKQFNILDLGAGAGIIPQMNFRGMVKCVNGIDPDQRVVENPYLDHGIVGFGESLPYENEVFDLVFADNVMEHLDNPDVVFNEIYRVLKPGGLFLGKTPNRLHYMPVISRYTPHWFHQLVNKWRGRDVHDTFPTCYKINTASDVSVLAKRLGFDVVHIKLIEGRPEYLRKIPIFNLFGLMYERVVNASELLCHFRILLIVVLRKK